MTGFHSVNPYTGEVLGHYPFISDQEISNKIADGQKNSIRIGKTECK